MCLRKLWQSAIVTSMKVWRKTIEIDQKSRLHGSHTGLSFCYKLNVCPPCQCRLKWRRNRVILELKDILISRAMSVNLQLHICVNCKINFPSLNLSVNSWDQFVLPTIHTAAHINTSTILTLIFNLFSLFNYRSCECVECWKLIKSLPLCGCNVLDNNIHTT